LVEWAYQLTKDTDLPDSEALQMIRKDFVTYPKAQMAPQILKGDQLSAMTFWHGKYMNDWANQWMQYWTQGKGNYVTTAMEDTGTLQALQFLHNAGRADKERALVLRTASNFSMPGEGITAAESMQSENQGYSAYLPSLEAAWVVGSKVVSEIIDNWDEYADVLPE
jgi:purine nucleoside permease